MMVKAKSQREKDIAKVSLVGIVFNAFLGVVKVIIGVITHSVSIITDAVNNLTDTSSSIITIIGTHLATRNPDARHPFGYGRVEYLTSLVIGLIVFFTGVEMCRTSIESIIHPHHVDFDWWAVGILAATVVVKIFLGAYTLTRGKKLKSSALVASGMDARSDAVATGAVMIAALLYMWKHIDIDAWVGAIISLYIVKTGYEILRDVVSKIVGEGANRDMAQQIYAIIKTQPAIKGAFDLIINNYGPNSFVGSINVEVPHDLTAEQICRLLHPLQQQIDEQLHTWIVFGIYAVDKNAAITVKASTAIEAYIKDNPECIGYHGLFVDEVSKQVFCDIVVDYGHDRDKVRDGLSAAIAATIPGFTPVVTVDSPSIIMSI